MERHHEGGVVSIQAKQLHSNLDVNLVSAIVYFPEFPHFTPFGKTEILDCSKIFFDGQCFQFPAQSVHGIFIWKQIRHSKLIRIFRGSIPIHFTLFLKSQTCSMIKSVFKILLIGSHLKFALNAAGCRLCSQVYASFVVSTDSFILSQDTLIVK